MILNDELDPCVALGFTGGPEFNTNIVIQRNAHERRNANWSQARHRYSAPFNNITDTEYRLIKRMFNACRGRLHGFLFKDPLDFQATAEPLGVAPAGSTPVQLVYVSTVDGQSHTRTITRPVAGTVTVYQDTGGGPVAKAGTYSSTTGLFTPDTAWTGAAVLTWTGEFRIPVRFDADWLPFSIDNKRGSAFAVNGSIDLVEVFGE